MGAYDEIAIPTKCKKCGKTIKSMQSKSGACLMKTYHKNDELYFDGIAIESGYIEVHGYCEHCLTWFDGSAVIKNNRIVGIKSQTFKEKIGTYKKIKGNIVIAKKRKNVKY